MIETILAAALRFDERHLLAAAVVAVIAVVVTSARRPSRRCKHCRQLNREHAVFCAQCGQRLREK